MTHEEDYNTDLDIADGYNRSDDLREDSEDFGTDSGFETEDDLPF